MLRVFFFLVFSVSCFAKPTICLNMIVKDESHIIQRCLDSVKPYIDYWVIVDTGSKDGTQKIIKKHMKDIPGKLYERKWKNWGESRTEALELAKGHADYILFMDADDILEFEGEPTFGDLTEDMYNMWRGGAGFSYLKPQIVRDCLPWKWVGVTHEYLDCGVGTTSVTMENVKYRTLDDGATRKNPKQKFLKNVQLLEDGLKKEPGNVRYMFYLAESYRDAGEKGKAVECFQKRIKMGGWEEELFWSMLQSALLLQELGLPHNVVAEAFISAHQFRPHRVEPIYYLAELYIGDQEYQKAYDLIKARELIPKALGKDMLFNMDWMEDYGLAFQLSICSYYAGNYQESLDICDQLINYPNLPENWRTQTITNRQYPLSKLEETQ
jgi:glycosyltransferase involved in cell wall biosynthesis